nr:type III-B CRISPR module RAMP protein Cmr4 [Anaerolineae bacterium]
PIAREKGTEIPIVPGSSVKGVLRDACEAKNGSDICTRIFGPETGHAAEHAGAVQITDLRLVALPVRSLAGVFAWVTSPFLLRRLKRDAEFAGHNDVPPVPDVSDTGTCLVTPTSALRLGDDVILEDVKMAAQDGAGAWAEWLAPILFDDETWQSEFQARLCVVHDDVMAFLLQVGTEVTARIRLKDEEKTVARGALWYEEALPAESILAGLVAAIPVAINGSTVQPNKVFTTVSKLVQEPLQVGGNATVGRGLCRLITV